MLLETQNYWFRWIGFRMLATLAWKSLCNYLGFEHSANYDPCMSRFARSKRVLIIQIPKIIVIIHIKHRRLKHLMWIWFSKFTFFVQRTTYAARYLRINRTTSPLRSNYMEPHAWWIVTAMSLYLLATIKMFTRCVAPVATFV